MWRRAAMSSVSPTMKSRRCSNSKSTCRTYANKQTNRHATLVASIGLALVLASIALLAFGVNWWPGNTALYGMLTHCALASLYLVYLGVVGEWVVPLLWPEYAGEITK